MGKRLNGKTILVTAAAQGIGKACVEAFQQEGAQVIASDINASKLDDLAVLPGVETRLLDVMDLTDIQNSSDEIGVLDASSIVLATFTMAQYWNAMRMLGFFF